MYRDQRNYICTRTDVNTYDRVWLVRANLFINNLQYCPVINAHLRTVDTHLHDQYSTYIPA